MLLVYIPAVFDYLSDVIEIKSALPKVILMKQWLNTNLFDSKTERKVERYQAGLSFLTVNLGVPWKFLLN